MGKYALLIGVDTYGEGLQPLPAASKDVAALRKVLLNHQMGGFDEAKLLINPMQPEMAREIELWFQDRQPEDLVLLFFSGHGVKDERRDLYFAARNTEKQHNRLLTSTATSARFIHDLMRGCKAKYQVLILDCCFSGAFGEFVARDDGEIPLKDQLGAEGRVVLTSTSAVDYSFEEKGADLSIYTCYLVEGIATGAADEDGDGVITVDELHCYAGRKVRETSPAMSPDMIILKGEGFRIRIARSSQDDPKLKYRKEAERRATTGEFTIPAKRLLMALRAELGLSDADTGEIEAEVLKPYQERQRKHQEYQETLRQSIEQEPLLSERTINDLRDYRAHLQLKPEDTASIERVVLGNDLEGCAESFERHSQQEKQQQKENQRRQRYEQEFSRALAAGYPLDRFVREELKRFQASLGLSDEVVTQIEHPLVAPKEAKYQQQSRLHEENARRHKEEAKQKRQAEAKVEEEHQWQVLQTTQGIDYSQLDSLLASQQWKEAELETCKVLAKASKSGSIDKWGYLYCCFENVPCEVFTMVDQLWISYSGARFGLSIQRKLFDDLNQDLGAFGRQVGWKGSTGMFVGIFSWKMKMNLTYDISAPLGHLPAVIIKGDTTGLDVIPASKALYSRLRACGL